MNLVLSLQVKKQQRQQQLEHYRTCWMFQNLQHSKKVKFKSKEQHERNYQTERISTKMLSESIQSPDWIYSTMEKIQTMQHQLRNRFTV